MNTAPSEPFVLKPSTARLFMVDIAALVIAYLLGGLLRAVFDHTPLETIWNENTLIHLAGAVFVGLLLVYNHAKEREIRLENGCIQGPISNSNGPGGFALDRLDRTRTLESLYPEKRSWLKDRYIWSVDGQWIIFQPFYYNPEDVEEFLRRLGL